MFTCFNQYKLAIMVFEEGLACFPCVLISAGEEAAPDAEANGFLSMWVDILTPKQVSVLM